MLAPENSARFGSDRIIITSVALIRAAAVWPFFNCISRTAPEVIKRSNQLAADRERHLRDQSANADVHDAAHELVAAADALVRHAAFASLCPSCDKAGDRFPLAGCGSGHRGFYGSQFAMVNPLLDRGIADLQLYRRVARTKQTLTLGNSVLFVFMRYSVLRTSEREAN